MVSNSLVAVFSKNYNIPAKPIIKDDRQDSMLRLVWRLVPSWDPAYHPKGSIAI